MGAPPRLGGVFGISHKLLDDRARWRPGHLKSSREKQNKYPPWPEGGFDRGNLSAKSLHWEKYDCFSSWSLKSPQLNGFSSVYPTFWRREVPRFAWLIAVWAKGGGGAASCWHSKLISSFWPLNRVHRRVRVLHRRQTCWRLRVLCKCQASPSKTRVSQGLTTVPQA